MTTVDIIKKIEFGESHIFESLDYWFSDKDKKKSKKPYKRYASCDERKKRVRDKSFAELKFLSSTDIHHQMLTLAKAKKDIKGLKKRISTQLEAGFPVIVLMDEMDAMKANPQGGFVTAYQHYKNNELIGYDHPVSLDIEQEELMNYLYQKEGVFIVLMSAERGIDKALKARGIEHHFIDRFVKLLDHDLSITYTKSTSSKIVEGSSSLLKRIVKIKEKWPDYALVSNSLTPEQKAILKARHNNLYA